jgi:tetratricopeptide (TPR) repeat protein
MLSDDEPAQQAQFVAIAVKLAEQLRVGGELGLARGLLEEVRAHCRDSRAMQAPVLRAAAHLWSAEGDHAGAASALREAIGLAIVTGQRDLICDLYLDMATAHLRESLATEAASELQEGIDLVTGGEGGKAPDGPASLWRMLYRLAQLYALEGRRDRAADMAEYALRHAMRAGARVGVARIRSMLAGLLEHLGDRRRAQELRDQAIEEMRRLGDRRGTAELLLDGARPTESFTPITSASLREAEELAQEIGWVEGERRARQVVTVPTERS